jgi:hypothetical protein
MVAQDAPAALSSTVTPSKLPAGSGAESCRNSTAQKDEKAARQQNRGSCKVSQRTALECRKIE